MTDADDPRYNARAAEFSNQFAEFVNASKSDIPDAVALMLREHRTLQQLMMRLCMEYIRGMANAPYDMRNEASVKLAQQIVAGLKRDNYGDFLPYV